MRASCSTASVKTPERPTNVATVYSTQHTWIETYHDGGQSFLKARAALLRAANQKHRWMFGYHITSFCFKIDME